MASVEAELTGVAPAVGGRRRPMRLVRRLARQPAALAAGLVLAAIFIVGAIVPWITPRGWNLIDLSARWRNHAPLLSGWRVLGTDGVGRNVLLRTLWGLHTSEQSAVYGTLLATAIGVAIGGIAGYRGGWADALLMRIGDVLGVFPALMLLLMAYTYFFPVTVFKATVLLACYLWIPVARVVRAHIASLRAREFVDAAISLGASDRRIFFRHLLPNAGSTIVVAAGSLLGQIVMLEATVEFFGLGVTAEKQPTLGNLIGDGQRNVLAEGWGWWTWAGPAIVLVVILVCANLLGDGVADAMRARRR